MQISEPKGFPLLWLLDKKHQRTEMLYPSTLFLADKAFCKKGYMRETALLCLIMSSEKTNNSLYNY